jgi:3-(3-hydroxy-phenyl)propionate hydroxylase
MSGREQNCDVAVVGLGPVGLAFAVGLAQRGHKVVGVELSAEVFDRPRAIGLDHESMRLFQSLGIADDMADIIETYRPSEYRAADGSVLRRLLPAPEPLPLSWPPNVTFVQPELERRLRDRAARLPNLDLRFAAQLVGAGELGSAPLLEMRPSAGGPARELRCQYVLGCDGAASFLRKAMGGKLEDLGFDEPWLVLDILLTQPVDLPELNIQFCNPARPATFVRGPGLLRRWEFMLLPGEAPQEMTRPEKVWELLRPWLTPDQAKIWRAATYWFHALVAEPWRRGKAFLAGDAAHQTPPFLAQGLNQGLRDAVNLTWKLSAVLGGAPEALLDSYEAERRPSVREVISITKALGREICERDPAAAETRNQRLRAEFEAGRGVRVRQDLLPPLRNRLWPADEALPPHAGEGEVAPQPWVRSDIGRARLDDVLGGGWRVLCASNFQAALALRRARNLGVHVARLGEAGEGEFAINEESGLLASWMAARDCRALLVRPDHIVYAAVSSAEDLDRALDRRGAALSR